MIKKRCEVCSEVFECKSNNQLFCEKCKYKERHYKPVKVTTSSKILSNDYYKYDIYEVGQVIELNRHKWTIEAMTGTIRKLYHCINEIGIRECFDCLQLKLGNLL